MWRAWNIEKGLALTGEEIAHAQIQRAKIFHNMAEFFTRYDALLCPATIVTPFTVEERYVKRCNGVEFETYIDWLLIVAVATLAMCPAISIPCGFTKDALPIGLQIIGPNRGETQLLNVAKHAEEVFALGAITPIDPRG
jgi:amidase